MKVAIVSPSTSPGGLYRVAIEETRYLLKAGYDVSLISLIKPVNPWNDLLEGLPVIYLADYHGPTPFISEMLNRNLFVINKLMENRYDVVICHNLPS
ncbi:MAG: hypothetical protein ACRD5H_07870, partial [Nitrososphaerales archaeon]